MDRDFGAEIDGLQKEMAQIKSLLQELSYRNTNKEKKQEKETLVTEEVQKKESQRGAVEIISDMHPDAQLSGEMEELCRLAAERNGSGYIDYMGVFASGGRQSNWIKHQLAVEQLFSLIENHTAEKVLRCIGNRDRLNILLAILKKPRTVAELMTVCNLNSTGQAYHHMKPLLAADLIAEDDATGTVNKGVYIVQPHKVQGIIMLLAGISDMVDETFTKGNWDNLEL